MLIVDGVPLDVKMLQMMFRDEDYGTITQVTERKRPRRKPVRSALVSVPLEKSGN